MAGILFIISAPSGSGKSTLVNQIKSLVGNLEFSVSYTTRAPRGSEQNGQQYHFIAREKFEQMVRDDEFLEHAEVFSNYYGTARKSLEDAKAHGKDLLLDIDVQGAAQVREKIPAAVSIFVMPPAPDVLATRLRNRSRAEGGVTEEVIQRRLAEARAEIVKYREYSYILVNDILARAEDELLAIVASERIHRKGNDSIEDADRLLKLAESCKLENSGDRVQPVLEAFGLLD
ncbi:guanylate kinase [Alloacidobacterium dinghuense]|uniref:Guanylate kinase n=1 Tax=Alloacidobacterium dinghuense TaxID=2763107 RepID=A0A7G8BP14_9BACT|nr:guanylate kinase [Alloacidobacterium dinghuense]QNI34284.1 guanylate kinase [Alloacidobacterium dinghuense]